MKFNDEASAKSFFINKITQQADREGTPLPSAQSYMLSWSETDPSFIHNPEFDNMFENEISQPEFEKKVQGLLRRAFDLDVSMDKDMKRTYREAYDILRRGDHFILIMISAAIGNSLKKWLLF